MNWKLFDIIEKNVFFDGHLMNLIFVKSFRQLPMQCLLKPILKTMISVSMNRIKNNFIIRERIGENVYTYNISLSLLWHSPL